MLDKNVTEEQRFRLVKLMEECAEVQKLCSKVMRFGWNNVNPLAYTTDTNAQRLLEELEDMEEATREVQRFADEHTREI